MIFTKRLIGLMGVGIALMATMPQMAQAAKKTQKTTGAVTAVNASTDGLTVFDKKTNTSVEVSVSSATIFTKRKNVGVSALASGDRIEVRSKVDLVPGLTTVDASQILLESPLAEPKKHEGAKSIEGTVISVSPVLTITTADGTSITVNTEPKTRVYQFEAATFTDIAVGDRVEVVGTPSVAGFVAKSVAIEPSKHKSA
jgi:hypothetical protein